MKTFTLFLFLSVFFFSKIEAQILEIPYSQQDVTVIVSSSIYNPDYSPVTNDPMLGLMVLYVSNGEDGSAWDGKLLKGTTYYKLNPDTLQFTSNSATNSLYIFALELQKSVNAYLGQYNVKVNGIDYVVDSSNIVYLLPCNEINPGVPISISNSTSFKNALLKQNFPNPFEHSTTINFSLNQSNIVKIDIFDIEGKLIKNLLNERMTEGQHNIIWNGNNNSGKALPTGNYFYKITVGNLTQSKMMILLK